MLEPKRVGGVWIKHDKGKERLFVRVGNKFYNGYPNYDKEGNKPDYYLYIGKKE